MHVRLRLLAFLLAGCSAQPGLPLRDTLNWASLGPLLGPSGPLGQDAAGPFRGAGWVQPRPESLSLKPDGPNSQLFFYLDQVAALEAEVEARASGGSSLLLLNSHPLIRLRLTEEWRRFHFPVAIERTREGANRIDLRAPSDSQWRALRLRVRHSSSPESWPKDRLCLGFGSSLQLPLQLAPGARLAWKDVRPWTAPGAAEPDLSACRLHLRLSEKSWELTCRGQQIRMAVRQPEEGALVLKAESQRPPLPGQLGVELIEPVLYQARPPQLAPIPAATRPAPVGRPPNLVVYLIDTLRADHLHCYGYPHSTSPYLDEFARSAVLFRSALAQTSWTKPSTATILTGLPPAQHQAVDFGDLLPDDVETLAERLQRAGYETRGLVSNPFVSQAFGFQQGFDHYDFLGQASARQLSARLAKDLAGRRSERPLFLYVHTLDPHSPYAPPPEFRPKNTPRLEFNDADLLECARRLNSGRLSPQQQNQLKQEVYSFYDGEVSANDQAFGELLATLRRHHLYEDSLIVVVSDHGEEFFEHGGCGHISSLHRELIQVPLLMKFPGQRWGGSEAQGAWHHLDIVPTLLAEAGLDFQGRGLAYRPELDAAVAQRPAHFSLCAGQDAEKFQQGSNRMLIMEGVQWQGFTLHHTLASRQSGRVPVELYDLARDPDQRVNLAFSRPEVRLKLEALFPLFGPAYGPRATPARPEDVRKSLRSLQYLQ